MTNTYRLISLLLALLCSWPAMSGQTGGGAWITADDMPDATYYLPPSADSTSSQYANDVNHYYLGKSLRGTERGRQALADADSTTTHLLEVYSQCMHINLTEQRTPAIYALLSASLGVAAASVERCNAEAQRRRPAVRLGEPLATGEEVSECAYPSEHACRGWVAALLLVELFPGTQDAILLRASEYGQSRVIVGAHWQSDIDVSITVAAACLARLHADAAFSRLMADAKAEVLQLDTAAHSAQGNLNQDFTGKTTPPPAATDARHGVMTH